MSREPLHADAPVSPIRVHRARNPKALFIGLGLLAVVVAALLAVYLGSPESVPVFLTKYPVDTFVGGLIGAFLGIGAGSYMFRHLFTYDPRDRTIRARDRWWGRWRVHPRKGFERLQYDARSRRVYEVRPDGRRHRIPIDSGYANRRDWQAFIERFERDHVPDITSDE
jgi:YD repeat-containing protein